MAKDQLVYYVVDGKYRIEGDEWIYERLQVEGEDGEVEQIDLTQPQFNVDDLRAEIAVLMELYRKCYQFKTVEWYGRYANLKERLESESKRMDCLTTSNWV